MLTQEEALEIYKSCGAYLEGHFKLTSGLHSKFYLQSALVLQYPHLAEKLCASIAEYFKDRQIDVVIGPAMGAILVSYEVARYLGARSVFAERVDNVLTLKRNFFIEKNERILVVEDVVTTGKSVYETIKITNEYSSNIVGIGALVDRGGGFTTDLDYFPLIRLNIVNYEPESCPLCKENMPLVKPGSRKI